MRTDLTNINEEEGFKVLGKFYDNLKDATAAASLEDNTHVLGWDPLRQGWVSVGFCGSRRRKGPVPGSGRYADGNTQGAPLLGVRLEPAIKARAKAVGGSAWVRSLILKNIEEAESNMKHFAIFNDMSKTIESKHLSIKAAYLAKKKLQRRVKLKNGESSYLPLTISYEDGSNLSEAHADELENIVCEEQ